MSRSRGLVWGLGLEHEFLVAAGPPGADGTTRVLESDRVVRAATGRDAEPPLRPVAVSASVAAKRAPPEPRRPPAGATAAARVHWLAHRRPLLFRDSWLPWHTDSHAWLQDQTADAYREHAPGESPHGARELLYAAFRGGQAPAEGLARAEALGRNKGLLSALERIALEWAQRTMPARAAHTRIVCRRASLYPPFVVADEGSPGGPGPRDSATLIRGLENVFRENLARLAARAQAAPQPRGLTDSAVSVDGDFVEVRSLRHANATASSVLSEVRRAERLVLAAASSLPGAGACRVLPHSGYARLSFCEGGSPADHCRDPRPDYAGSYHVWITLPHPPRKTWPDNPAAFASFLRGHALLLHRLQWLEPLLLSAMSGDPRAVGGGLAHPRCSMRSAFNPLYGLGTASAPGFLPPPPPGVHVHAYRTREDAAAAASGQARPQTPVALADADLFVSIHGVEVPYMACSDHGRVQRDDATGWADAGPLGPPGGLLRNGFDRALAQAGATYRVSANTDVRTAACSSTGMELEDGWETVWVLSRPRGGRPQLRMHHARRPPDGPAEVVYDAPLRRGHHGEPRGVEFRLLDNAPSERLLPVLRAIALLAAGAALDAARLGEKAFAREISARAAGSPAWARAAADISSRGFLAPLDAPQLREFAERLGVPGALGTQRLAAFDALAAAGRALEERFARTEPARMLLGQAPPRPGESAGDVHCFAWDSWRDEFERRLAEDPALLASLAEGGLPRAAVPPGWEPDMPYVARWLAANRGAPDAAPKSRKPEARRKQRAPSSRGPRAA